MGSFHLLLPLYFFSFFISMIRLPFNHHPVFPCTPVPFISIIPLAPCPHRRHLSSASLCLSLVLLLPLPECARAWRPLFGEGGRRWCSWTRTHSSRNSVTCTREREMITQERYMSPSKEVRKTHVRTCREERDMWSARVCRGEE